MNYRCETNIARHADGMAYSSGAPRWQCAIPPPAGRPCISNLSAHPVSPTPAGGPGNGPRLWRRSASFACAAGPERAGGIERGDALWYNRFGR